MLLKVGALSLALAASIPLGALQAHPASADPNAPHVTIGRFYNGRDHAAKPLPAGLTGYHSESPYGQAYVSQQPGTHALYECVRPGGSDYFTSGDPFCENAGASRAWTVGYVMDQSAPGLTPLRRCVLGNGDHFDSLESNCEGATNEGVFGYVIARATIMRYNINAIPDHAAVYQEYTIGTWPFQSTVGNAYEGMLGDALTGTAASTPGTHVIYECLRNSNDFFTTGNSNCEGYGAGAIKSKLGALYDTRNSIATVPVYRCSRPQFSNGDHFDSNDPNCEGQMLDGLLGWAIRS